MKVLSHFTHSLRPYRFHVISWGLFVLYEVLVTGLLHGRFSSWGDYALHYSVNIALFYVHAHLLLPFCLRGPAFRYGLLPVLVVAEIAAFTALIFGLETLAIRLLDMQMLRAPVLDEAYFLRSVWRAIYFLGFGTAYYFLRQYVQQRVRAEASEKLRLQDIIDKERLQHELVRSQNAFLKAQINPHFLFNTLSFIYNSVRKSSHEAAEAILSLSQMMRYALQSEDEHQQTDLLAEIAHVEHLIHIHQIRHDHRLQLHYGPGLAGIRFIPLVLLTLVENMFKHGDLGNAGHPARIHISHSAGTLRIRTSNLALRTEDVSHRIGLDNIHRRLTQAYREQVSFSAFLNEAGYFHTVLDLACAQTLLQPQPTPVQAP